MFSLHKKIIALFVLASFLAVIFFSLPMMRVEGGDMQAECPFSPMGVSVCPQEVFASAVHHISAYQSFLNVTLHPSMALLLASLLFFALVSFVLSKQPPLEMRPVLAKRMFPSPPADSQKRNIAEWLSLLELSPSSS